MKKIIIIRYFLLILLCCFTLIANATKYRVSAQSTLNVRSNPSTSANIVTKLQSGDIVESNAEATENGWIEIIYNGTIGYVKASYLQPIEEETDTPNQVMKDDSSFATIANTLLGGKGDGSRKLAYLILAEVLIMWFICKFLRGLTPDFEVTRVIGEDWLKWATPGIMLVTSCTIFYYVKSLDTNSLWFLQPSIVNTWWLILLNFVIFFYAFTNLLVFFIMTIGDLGECFWSRINIKVGMIGWALGIIGFVISYFCKKEWLDYVLWFEVAIQGIQVVMIACSIQKNKLLGIPLSCAVYLLGSIAIVLLALPLTVIAIAVAIGIMIICFLSKADTSNLSSTDTNGLKMYHLDRDGTTYHLTQTYQTSECDFTDQYGNRWEKNGDYFLISATL